MPTSELVYRTVVQFSAGEVLCWFCQQKPLPLVALEAGQEQQVECPHCGIKYIVTGGGYRDVAWYGGVMTAGGLDGIWRDVPPGAGAPASPTASIRAFLDAYDANAPISDLVQGLRNALQRG